MALARHLAQGHGFSFDGITPSTYRPPLFSALLAAWCYLLGSTSLKTMVAFQVLVQTLCVPLTYLLARQVQPSQRLAVTGGLFVGAYPFIVSTAGLILQEPIQMLVATMIGIAVAAWCRQPTQRRAVVAGLLFGLGALAKAPFLMGPVILLCVALLSGEFRRQVPLGQAVLAGLLAAAVVLPWTVRNYRVSGGRLILVNSQNVTLPIWLVADGNFRWRESLSEPLRETPTVQKGVALTYGNQDGVDYLNQKNDELLQQGVSGGSVPEALATASRSYLMGHPAYLLKLMARGTLLLFSPDSGAGLTRSLGARVAAMVLFHLPLAAGLVAGVLRGLREKNAALLILSLFTVAYLLLHAPAAISGGRYSVPFLPLLIAISAYALRGDRLPRAPSAAAS